MLFLESAIYDKLNSDTELVGLLGHSASNIAIFSDYPDGLAKYPCIAFWDESSKNDNYAIDEIKSTIFNFGVFTGVESTSSYNSWTTKGKLLCTRIADRLEAVLFPGQQKDVDLTNSQVRSLAVLFLSRLKARFQIENSVYRIDIMAQINWHNK